MEFIDTKINHGGMLRCCIVSLNEQVGPREDVHEGQVVECKYCSNHSGGFVLRDGVWIGQEWDRKRRLKERHDG